MSSPAIPVPGNKTITTGTDRTKDAIAANSDRALGVVASISEEDAEIFRAEMAELYPRRDDIVTATRNILKRAKDLTDARAKWELAKGLYAKPTEDNRVKHTFSLKRWLLPGARLQSAVQRCVTMEGQATAEKSDAAQYILWTGGAADCVAIATYDGNEAWLTHATALVVNKPEKLIGDLIERLKRGNEKRKVHLSSQKPQTDLENALKANGVEYEMSRTGRIAINARTGEVVHSFVTNELPK